MLDHRIVKPTVMQVALFFSRQSDSRTISEVARATKLSYNTVASVLKLLIEFELVFVEKEVGRIKLYRKTKNEAWQHIESFMMLLPERNTVKERTA